MQNILIGGGRHDSTPQLRSDSFSLVGNCNLKPNEQVYSFSVLIARGRLMRRSSPAVLGRSYASVGWFQLTKSFAPTSSVCRCFELPFPPESPATLYRLPKSTFP